MRVSHKNLLRISGIVWLGIGLMLLNLGLNFLMQGWDGIIFRTHMYSSFFSWLSKITTKPENAACVLIALAFILGIIKSRKVMTKVVEKSHKRISQLENPTSIKNLYTKANVAVIVAMMLLGISMKYLHIAPDIRGFIDIAVGTALIHGAASFFKVSTNVGKSKKV